MVARLWHGYCPTRAHAFITILFFDSLDDIKAVAGADYETAVIPQERRQHLSRFDAKATHYDAPASHAITFATSR
jgi:hypothetical protein